MILANGISNPILGWELFLFMEIITIVIETFTFAFIYYEILTKKYSEYTEKLGFFEVLIIVILINLASALFCFPYWDMIGD